MAASALTPPPTPTPTPTPTPNGENERNQAVRRRLLAAPVVTLVALVLTALVLRWPIANHDVEHYVGPDEGEVVENVLEILKTGDFDHRHPGYPGLHFYVQLVPAATHLWLARLRGDGASVAELPRSGFYLLARRVTLLAGVLSGLAVFWASRSSFGTGVALVSAALTLFSPLAFRESAVVNPDLMLMLFVTVSLGLSLRLLTIRDRTRTDVALAGASVGLATAIKYTGIFAGVAAVLAWWLAGRGTSGGTPAPGKPSPANWPEGFLGVAAALVAFAVASPYTILGLPEFIAGVTTHAEYYGAATSNAALSVSRALFERGLGPLAALAALAGAARAMVLRENAGIVLSAYVGAYLLVFSVFDRAFPRHALALLPAAAILAGSGASLLLSHRRRGIRYTGVAVAGAVLLIPVVGTVSLRVRVSRPTATERAAQWIDENLPEGSRVLQDQFTPSLDSTRFRAHRLRVEERRFVGNYDWVLYSGYPPGLRTDGLREVARFEPDGAIGDGVIVFEVPPRETLMGITLHPGSASVRLGAGEHAYFGEGFYPPRPGAIGTSRLSQGGTSEIFFVLPLLEPKETLVAALLLSPATRATVPEIHVRLNDVPVAPLRFTEPDIDEPEVLRVTLPDEILRHGINRLELHYSSNGRLDRRHPDTAIRLYEVILARLAG